MEIFQWQPSAELQVDNVVQTVVSVTTTSAVVLAANPERKYVLFRAQGAGTNRIYLKFAAVAATVTNAYELLDAAEREEGVGTGKMIYTGEVRAITNSGSKDLYVEERY